MARATVPAGSSRAQTTGATPGVSDETHTSAHEGDPPAFANLIDARNALWRAVCDLDDPMTELEGDLSAIEALTLLVVNDHKDQLGPTATGLHHCARRALASVRKVRAVQGRVGDAALVVRENDPTRLSAEACRGHRPGPHVSTYAGQGGGR